MEYHRLNLLHAQTNTPAAALAHLVARLLAVIPDTPEAAASIHREDVIDWTVDPAPEAGSAAALPHSLGSRI